MACRIVLFFQRTNGREKEGFRVSFALCLASDHIKPYKTLRIKIEKRIEIKELRLFS